MDQDHLDQIKAQARAALLHMVALQEQQQALVDRLESIIPDAPVGVHWMRSDDLDSVHLFLCGQTFGRSLCGAGPTHWHPIDRDAPKIWVCRKCAGEAARAKAKIRIQPL